MAKVYYAHTFPDDPRPENWQALPNHLQQTAGRARDFAEPFHAGQWGHTAGLWHDLGKYAQAFQNKLLATCDPDAHIESHSHVDHSTAAAILASQSLNRVGKLLAYVIAGHHAGLTDGLATDEGDRSSLQTRLKNTGLLDEITPIIPDELSRIPHIKSLPFAPARERFAFQASFFVRMLYSALVDADFLDTEQFMNPNRAAQRLGYPSLQSLWPKLRRHLDLLNQTDPHTTVNRQRLYVQERCLDNATKQPGLFSLTVPTGGGKTLSSLAFALSHAIAHGLDRIIYVIPFTSIIEQNASVFRRVLGDDAVLEHHSNFEPNEEDHRTRLAGENWDAPIVVTTNVQFFESLFANRSSRCRKLHNIARSVIILDEAQTLPASYLRPCIETLRELTLHYNSSIVLCTATQPAIQHRNDFHFGLQNVQEIIDRPDELFLNLKRVTVETLPPLTDDVLAERIADAPQVLCIVNTRRHAQELFEKLKSTHDVFHLSALMCPAHRTAQLNIIRDRLKQSLPCRVISTQVVEAGVDIDFPVVYRAIAGLDSIAQAAGRCNREGKRPTGHVYVFRTAHKLPAGFFRQTAQVTEEVLRHHPDDILSLQAVEEYFKTYYWSKGEKQLDEKDILKKLQANERDLWFPFRTVAELFEIIENNTRPIVIPFDATAESTIDQMRHSPFPAAFTRPLQKYTVTIHHIVWKKLLDARAIELLHDQFAILTNTDLYRPDIGLCTDNPYHHDVESLIVD